MLSNIRHVPTLRNNLILLDYLKSQGYSFSAKAESGCLNQRRDGCYEMKACRLPNNLYGMTGEVVLGQAESLYVVHDVSLVALPTWTHE